MRFKIKSLKMGIIAGALLMNACGQNEIDDAKPSSFGSDDAQVAEQDQDMAIPPAEYYDAAMKENLRLIESGEAYQLATKPILYVNFDGATVKKGYGRGESFILCRSSATIPKVNYAADKKAQILSMIASYYTKAGASLTVTDKKPSSGIYTTIHVGGTYANLGCGLSGSVLGIAPFDVGNKNPNDVGFAFTNEQHSAFTVATTIAHEAGHSYGLAHVGSTSCVMYPSIQKNIQAFQNVAKQNAPAILKKVLGSGSADVDGNGGNVAPNDNSNPITPDNPNRDNSNNNQIIPNPTPSPIPNIPGSSILGNLADIIKNMGQNQNIDIQKLLPIIIALIPGGTSNLPQLQLILTAIDLLSKQNPNLNIGDLISNGQLPDLNKLLGINSNQGPMGIMKQFADLNKLINSTYSGNTQQAMLSLTRLAFAQSLVP